MKARFLPAGCLLTLVMTTWAVVATPAADVDRRASPRMAPAPLDQKGVEYGRPNGHALLLDLHVPDGPGPFPAAILVHGGGFDGGSRSTNMSPTFQPLAEAGFAWFSIDYRMAPEFRFAEARQDIDAAIIWVRANANAYRVDPSKIVLAGESAGGFLVNYTGTHGTPATKVAAVVDIYGPVDYEKIARQRQAYPNRFNMTSVTAHLARGGSIAFFGAEGYDEASFAALKAISPIHAVHSGMPPFLAIHGTRDDQVPYEQSTLLCAAMHQVGARCDIITVEAGGHGMSSWKDADQLHYKAEMIAWLQDVLAVNARKGLPPPEIESSQAGIPGIR
jgi:acetyl esterase